MKPLCPDCGYQLGSRSHLIECRTAVRHLTVPELAARRGVSVKTVYRWNTEGTGPKRLRQGKRGKVTYRLADVETWEKAQLIDSGTSSLASR